MKIFLMILEILLSLCLIGTILMQSSRAAGVSGAIGGMSDQFFGKKKGLDELLSKVSAVLLAAVFIIALIIAIVF